MDSDITTKAELEAAIETSGDPFVGFWNNTLTQQAGLSMSQGYDIAGPSTSCA
jgi:hypothetical protein